MGCCVGSICGGRWKLMDWFSLALGAIKEFFGWKKQKEINLPGQQKRDEIQTIRKERDDDIKKIDDWASNDKPS